MNILFISYHPFPNGMAGSKRIRLFAESLSNDHTVKVITLQNSGTAGNKTVHNKKIVHQTITISLLESLMSKQAKKILAANFEPGVSNVLFLYDGIGLLNLSFAKQARKLGYKVVTDVVEDYSVHLEKTSVKLGLLHKLNSRIEKRTAKVTDGVVVLSDRLFEKFRNLKVSNGHLINIPVSAENIDLSLTKNTSNKFRFVYSGSYGNKDGIYFLLEAFSKLHSEHPDCELVLAGNIPQHITLAAKKINSVVLAGLISSDNYYQFIQDADVLMVTRPNSDYANSGFPFKLGEYLATGNAVIATRVSDIEKYLQDKKDIIFAEPSSVNSLKDAMAYAFKNRSLLSGIGTNGKNKCLKHFHPKVNGKLLEDFLKNLTHA